MASHLSSGRVNVALLREDARLLLLDCLDKCNGTKVLFWDEKLVAPLGLIAEYALLKDHNVTEMFELKSQEVAINAESVVFLTRPKLSLIDTIADFVTKMEKAKLGKKDYHIIFVPRKTLLCEKILSEREVLGNFTNIFEYPVELFPFDSDVLSMELDYAFKECYVDEDLTSMFHVARALMTIQAIYGVIPNVYGKGKLAKHVFDLMVRMRRDLTGNDPEQPPQIHSLVLFDRSVDLLSVVATQLTYEGLLDEIFGIRSNVIKVPPEKFSNTPNEGGLQSMPTVPKPFQLNSAEALFAELRDKNFHAVGPLVSKKAKLLRTKYDERHGAKTPREIKKFVDKLPHLQTEKKSLTTHTSMAELIKEVTDSETFLTSLQIEQEFMNGFDTDKVNIHIEDCIAKEEPLIKVLRLICLQCIANNGLKQKVLEYYKREILQAYGFEHFITLLNLEKAGLFKLQGNKVYTTLRKTLKLIVEDVNEQDPNDISYVHSIYAPLSIRLVQYLNSPGWRAIPDILNILPGPTVEEIQELPQGLRKRHGSASSLQSSSDKKMTLVFFLGGCTFAEISALRFLSKQDNAMTEYLVATTKLINGRNFIQSLQETLNRLS